MSVDTGDYDLNEQYFNFAEFKGINSNKNYVGIDQQSFEDAKNVYVDQNNQLSTRPITKRLDILPADETVVDVIKVNNLVIYQTVDSDNNYWIRFNINGKWYDHQVTEKIHICWYKDKYILFTENNLEAWSYDYSNTDPEVEPLTWFTTSQIVYMPVTQIISGSTITNLESDNIFTSGHIIRYDFEAGMTTLTTDLEGKTVTIQVDNEIFENVVWKQNMEVIFTKPLGSVVCNRIEAKAATGTEGGYRYFAYNLDNSGPNATDLYLSLDGLLFVPLPRFTGDSDCCYTLSDDGLRILGFDTNSPGYGWAGLWYFDIPTSTSEISTTSWTHIWNGFDSNEFTIELNSANSGKSNNNSSRLIVTIMSGRIYPTAHAPDSNHVVFLAGAQVQWYNLQNQSLVWQDPQETGVSGTHTSGTRDCNVIIICDYTGTGAWSGWQVQCWPLWQWVSLPYAPAIWHQVRYIRTNDNRHFITTFAQTNGTTDRYVTPHYIVLKSDNTPYMSIQYNSTFGFVTPLLLQNKTGDSFHLATTDAYGFDVSCGYNNGSCIYYAFFNGYVTLTTNYDTRWRLVANNFALNSWYNESDYTLKCIYTSTAYDDRHRNDYPLSFDTSDSAITVSQDYSSIRFKLSTNAVTAARMLTDKYFVYGNTVITDGNNLELLQRPANETTKYEVIPLYVTDDGQNFGYYSIGNNTIYTNNYEGHVYVDYVESGGYNYYVPEYSADMIDKVLAWDNLLYWTSSRVDDDPNSDTYNEQLLYVSSANVEEFEDIITNLVVFSQTSLGVFLSNSVYEFQYSETLTNSLEQNAYILTPTKLQMGCKKGSDIIIAYSSSQILLTNIKGLTVLTYQNFVQSTEQIFSYLTENIMNEFYSWAHGPIKLYQYKDWLFVYQQDDNLQYVYDMRNSSWWKWETLYPIQKFVTVDDELYFIMNELLYTFDFDEFSVYDDEVNPFDWYFVSQKLHFNAPNYYKVVKQLSVLTSQSGTELRYKLMFKNYHNTMNIVDVDTVEFNIDQLNTLIKRVTFMKLNAFQFAISNDKTNPQPTPFTTSDIAIQFRITERVR